MPLSGRSPGGKHKGDLLVVQHRYLKDAPGTYDACVVVDGRSGNQLREVTELVEGCGDSPAMKKALGY